MIYNTQIRGFQQIMNKESGTLFRDINSFDWESFLSQFRQDTDKDTVEQNVISFLRLAVLSWDINKTLDDVTGVCRNHSISLIVNAIKPFIKDKSIIDNYIRNSKVQLDQVKIEYLSRHNLIDLKELFVSRLAKKIVSADKYLTAKEFKNLILKREFDKTFFGIFGSIIPDCNNLMYSYISTGTTDAYDKKKFSIEDGKELSRNQVVISNQWIAARPLDEDCYSVHLQKRKVGQRFSNGLYGPKAHPNCLCILKPIIVSRKAIDYIIKRYK